MIEIPTTRIEAEIGTKEIKRLANLVCSDALPMLKPGLTFESAAIYKLKKTGKYYSVLGFFRLKLTGPDQVTYDLCALWAARNTEEHLMLQAFYSDQKRTIED